MNRKEYNCQKMALIDGVLRLQDKPITIKKIAQLTGIKALKVDLLLSDMQVVYNAPVEIDREHNDEVYYTVKGYTIGMDNYLVDQVEQIEKSNEKRKTGLKFTSREKENLTRNIAIAELLVEKQKQQEEEKNVTGKWILRLISEPTKYLMSQTKRGYPVITLDKTKAIVFTDSNVLKKAIRQLGGLFELEVIL